MGQSEGSFALQQKLDKAMLVHKEQCRDLAKAKKLEVEGKISSRVPVGMYSHHPFPKEGLPEDTLEVLTVQVHRILIKMRLAGHPAHADSRIHDYLLELEKDMQWNRDALECQVIKINLSKV